MKIEVSKDSLSNRRLFIAGKKELISFSCENVFKGV